MAPTTIREVEVAGEVPRFELAEWRERYGVVAGITGRGGEPTPFDLGLWTSSPVREVMTRWRLFRRAEPDFQATILATQVHSADVRWHDQTAGWVQHDGFDGHATSTPGLLLTVTVADCIPVYLVAPSRGAIALLHAGWRGTAAGILARGTELLKSQAGVSQSDLVMHCGVGICGPCYEVGSEVVQGCGLPADGAGPWHIDLRDRLAEQAQALGIAEVTRSAWCSAHDRDRFFSHRASKGVDGRMVAYLGLSPSR